MRAVLACIAASQRYKLRELTTKEVMEEACSVLSGHDNLILQFGEFLPGVDMLATLNRSKGASATGAVLGPAAAVTPSNDGLDFLATLEEPAVRDALEKFKTRLPHENFTELMEILSKAKGLVTRDGEEVSSRYAEVSPVCFDCAQSQS